MGTSGGAGQQHRTFFGDEARTAWAVDGEGRAAAVNHERVHLQQAALASAGTGAAYRYIAEAANDARDELAVVALAGEDGEIPVAENPGRSQNTTVPEGINARINIVHAADGAVFPGEFTRSVRPTKQMKAEAIQATSANCTRCHSVNWRSPASALDSGGTGKF